MEIDDSTEDNEDNELDNGHEEHEFLYEEEFPMIISAVTAEVEDEEDYNEAIEDNIDNFVEEEVEKTSPTEEFGDDVTTQISVKTSESVEETLEGVVGKEMVEILSNHSEESMGSEPEILNEPTETESSLNEGELSESLRDQMKEGKKWTKESSEIMKVEQET